MTVTRESTDCSASTGRLVLTRERRSCGAADPRPRLPRLPRIAIPVDISRRKFLIAFGLAYIGIGYSFLGAAPTTPARLALAWNHVPFWLFGIMWMGCGLGGMIASFVPSTRDKPGFLLLSIPPVVWSLGYFIAALFEKLSTTTTPRPGRWSAASSSRSWRSRSTSCRGWWTRASPPSTSRSRSSGCDPGPHHAGRLPDDLGRCAVRGVKVRPVVGARAAGREGDRPQPERGHYQRVGVVRVHPGAGDD